MSRLSIFPEKVSSDGRHPSLEQLVCTDDPEQIGTELFRRGIGFERWPAEKHLDQMLIKPAFSGLTAMRWCGFRGPADIQRLMRSG